MLVIVNVTLIRFLLIIYFVFASKGFLYHHFHTCHTRICYHEAKAKMFLGQGTLQQGTLAGYR